MRIGIPYKVVGGVRFYERKEIKDFLAYLRVIVNPNDEVSLRRIINTPKRGIGDRALDLLDLYAQSNNLTFWQSLCEVEKNQEIAQRSAASLIEFVKLIQSLQTLVEAKTRPSVVAQAVLRWKKSFREICAISRRAFVWFVHLKSCRVVLVHKNAAASEQVGERGKQGKSTRHFNNVDHAVVIVADVRA